MMGQMYRYSASMNTGGSRRGEAIRRLLIAAVAGLSIAVLVLVIILIRTGTPGVNVHSEIMARINSDLSSAITVLNRMDRSTTSKTMSDIGRIRQYVYAIEEMNKLSIALESNRLISDDVFAALYSDIDSFEALLSGAKSSTLDAQTLLLTHLTNLQTLLAQ
ncbi:MAG: hypothetical protein IKP22_15860 [Clostridia bacterium]|nr:hypothetical protein [Clostridia bacterium]